MKEKGLVVFCIFLLTVLLPSCATINKPEVKVIDEKPAISKTVQDAMDKVFLLMAIMTG